MCSDLPEVDRVVNLLHETADATRRCDRFSASLISLGMPMAPIKGIAAAAHEYGCLVCLKLTTADIQKHGKEPLRDLLLTGHVGFVCFSGCLALSSILESGISYRYDRDRSCRRNAAGYC